MAIQGSLTTDSNVVRRVKLLTNPTYIQNSTITKMVTGMDRKGFQWQIVLDALPPGVTMDMVQAGQEWFIERRTTYNRLFLYCGEISVSTVQPNVVLSSAIESFNQISTPLQGNQSLYLEDNSSVFFYTSSAINTFSFNITGSSTSTLNSLLQINQSIIVAILTTQADPAYYCTGITIDGKNYSTYWSNGITPITGNKNSIDSYTFQALKTADSTFTVLASLSKF
jgi:hypothetical protein